MCETRLMPTPEYETSPSEVRTFAYLQLGLTTAFLVLLFFAFGGTSSAFPPWWLIAVLLAVTAITAFLAERVWLSARPMSPDRDPDEMQAEAVGIFASQIVRKLAYCEAGVHLRRRRRLHRAVRRVADADRRCARASSCSGSRPGRRCATPP